MKKNNASSKNEKLMPKYAVEPDINCGMVNLKSGTLLKIKYSQSLPEVEI